MWLEIVCIAFCVTWNYLQIVAPRSSLCNTPNLWITIFGHKLVATVFCLELTCLSLTQTDCKRGFQHVAKSDCVNEGNFFALSKNKVTQTCITTVCGRQFTVNCIQLNIAKIALFCVQFVFNSFCQSLFFWMKCLIGTGACLKFLIVHYPVSSALSLYAECAL